METPPVQTLVQGRTAGSTAIREVMTASVTPDRTVEECRKIMGETRIRHLPVLDGEKVIGVLSSKDILDEIITEDEQLIRQLETERLTRLPDDEHRQTTELADRRRPQPERRWAGGNQTRAQATEPITRPLREEYAMSFLICLAALIFLMLVAYRGFSVILFAPVAALLRYF